MATIQCLLHWYQSISVSQVVMDIVSYISRKVAGYSVGQKLVKCSGQYHMYVFYYADYAPRTRIQTSSIFTSLCYSTGQCDLLSWTDWSCSGWLIDLGIVTISIATAALMSTRQ